MFAAKGQLKQPVCRDRFQASQPVTVGMLLHLKGRRFFHESVRGPGAGKNGFGLFRNYSRGRLGLFKQTHWDNVF